MRPFAAACLCAALVVPTLATAEITLYEYEGFRGRSFTVNEDVRNFDRHGFNDKAQSAIVGAGRWEVCADARFEGECRILRRGSYDSLRSLNMVKRISSARRVESGREGREVAPAMSEPDYAYHRRPREQVYEARVISVREVRGTAERHCWVESEPTATSPSGRQVGAAIAGALIGGIIGHQVGSGRGNQAATAAGAAAGAALASKASQSNYGNTHQRQVQRCDERGSGQPAYYDVLYEFDGDEHHAQTTAHPGRTLLVNERGEPRQ